MRSISFGYELNGKYFDLGIGGEELPDRFIVRSHYSSGEHDKTFYYPRKTCLYIEELCDLPSFFCSKCGIVQNYVPKFCPECGAEVVGVRKEVMD